MALATRGILDKFDAVSCRLLSRCVFVLEQVSSRRTARDWRIGGGSLGQQQPRLQMPRVATLAAGALVTGRRALLKLAVALVVDIRKD